MDWVWGCELGREECCDEEEGWEAGRRERCAEKRLRRTGSACVREGEVEGLCVGERSVWEGMRLCGGMAGRGRSAEREVADCARMIDVGSEVRHGRSAARKQLQISAKPFTA